MYYKIKWKEGVAIGYLRTRLINFIVEIQNIGHCTSLHGNKHYQREKNNITIAKVLFESYIKDFGVLIHASLENTKTERWCIGTNYVF